jgi:nitric-oxide synthase
MPEHDPTHSREENLLSEAKAFLKAWMADERGRCPFKSAEELEMRLREIAEEITQTGTYTHTAEELAFGARLAWLNSNRCVGRHFWRTLQVRDAREVRTAEEVVAQLDEHMASAFNGGKIRSFITVFAPRTPGKPDPIRMANHQLIRYAHFGEGLGDPATADFTKRMLENGWVPRERTAFMPLPWEIHIAGERHAPRDVFAERPERLVEVPLSHPECDAFAAKGWKWYALPLLSELALKVGGVVYPCTPFNGYYMGTEIGARNLADRDRYNLLPEVAGLFGLDTSSERTLWRDRALTELNRAVLHSFDEAGITIGDHHGLGEGFEQFCLAEEKAGREVTGDWVWLNPPMSSPQTPQFHREYRNEVAQHTNFFYQPAPGAQAAAQPSPQNCPFHLSQA